MASDSWQVATLGSIARAHYGLVDGPFGSNLPASDYTDSGIPVIRGCNLSLGQSRFDDREFVFVSEATAARLARSLCEPGDIIFTKKGTLGQTGVVPRYAKFEKFLLSSNQMKLSVDPAKANPLFVYYVVSSASSRSKIIQDSSITGVPKTNLAYLKDFPILLPSLTEQTAIAGILGTLDDKIELNRRRNETLEGMARTLFKSWFVDFDPVRAKAEGRNPGLPQPLADLFSDSCEESELGEIPRGWQVATVDEHFDLTMGQSPPGETYNEIGEGTPFFQGRADFGFRFPRKRVYCTAPTRFAKPGDTLVSVRAPVGDINMATERCCVGRGVAAVRHKSGSRSYTYYYMRSLRQVFDKFEAEGTVFGAISKRDFHAITRVVPPASLVSEFERMSYPVDESIKVRTQEIETLTSLRDTLLPELISGDLRIPDAERIIGGQV